MVIAAAALGRNTMAQDEWGRLERFTGKVEVPMFLLAIAWIVLVILELTSGLSPALEKANAVIWGVFILEFLVELTLAPKKVTYLARNWITVLALVVPAFRVFRIVRVLRIARAARGVSLLRLVTSFRRGATAFGRVLEKRGFGYVLAITIIVVFAGAAGIFAFERGTGNSEVFERYWSSVWWTAMMVTTMGTDYWPFTLEGRVLALLLALYAFAVFGYVAATIASYFVGKDAHDDGQRPLEKKLDELLAEVRALRKERGRD